MAIATTNVAMSDIASEIAVGNTDFSLGDNSISLWKNGPTAHASFLETRYFGSNCQFSTVVAAQGSAIQSSTDPWDPITANGMNAKPCGMGEWKGYDHFPTGGVAGRSTIGRFRVGTDANSQWNGNDFPDATNPSPLNDVAVHAGSFQRRTSTLHELGETTAPVGIAIWAYKALGVVYIYADDPTGNFGNTNSSVSATNIQRLGPDSGTSGTAGNGAGQSTTADQQAPNFSASILMKITGAARITGCKMTLQGGLPTDSSQDGFNYSMNDPDGSNPNYTGNKVETIGHHDEYEGATSTTNFGAERIGYDLCCGGSRYGEFWHNEIVHGVEFNFYATQNDGVVLNSNPLGPVGFRSHKITVYVSMFAMGEWEYTG